MADTYTSKAKLAKPAAHQTGWNVEMDSNWNTLDAVPAVGDLAVTTTEVPSTTLNIRVAAGSFRKSDGTIVDYAGAASTTLTASSTNYVYLTNAGVLTVNTTGFPASTDIVRLATVVAGTASITSIAPVRVQNVAAGATQGSGAPQGSSYVVISADATLTADRVLTGTANRITIADGGANSTVTLSTPQDIHTGASPTFAGLTLSSALPIASGGTSGATAAAARNALLPSQTSNSGKVLSTDGTNVSWIAATGTGTVTSVGLSLPTGLTASGSPVTTSGVIAVSLGVSGVIKGSGGAFVAATAGTDFYAPAGTDVAVADGGTGASTALAGFNALSPLTTKGDVLSFDGTNNVRLSVGSNGQVLTADSTQSSGVKWSATAGTGTVTSVALTVPAEMNATGSPVTGSGTLAVTWATETTNKVFAAPNGSTGVPTFRALASADLPTVAETKGGTNQTTYATGDTLYASASNTLSKLAANSTATRKFYMMQSSVPSYVTLAAGDYPVFVASGASHAAGAVPDPGVTAGTTKFLREDATWAVPAGGGGSPGGSTGQVQYNNASAFGGATNASIGASGNLQMPAMSAPGTPTTGDLWTDTTRHGLATYQSGMTGYPVVALYGGHADTGPTFTNGYSPTTILPTASWGTKTIAANFLAVGKKIRIKATGFISKRVASNLTIAVTLGGSTVATTGAVALVGTGTALAAWELEAEIVCDSTGLSGTVHCSGLFTYENGTTMQGQSLVSSGSSGFSTGTTTVTTSGTLAVDVTAVFSVTSSNTLGITCNSATIEAVG